MAATLGNNDRESVMQSVRALVDEYRTQALWYLREDFYPETAEEACRTLEAIEKHADLAAFKRAAPLRQWLSRNSNEPSVA
ncbi:MAG: hypothetical protein K1X53_15180 [Candidatus Sumerlaeaceae bacterium]|nr:hypothetical protein [Candidatus Sumerlaeaceae bacterium]